jgi:pilus assembly protein CpaC
MPKHILRRPLAPPVVVSLLLAMAARPALLNGQEPASPPISFQVQRASERMEMTVNTSRILTLDQKIWKVQVNNRDILEQTPLSPTQVQVFAKQAGVTQVNLFSEDNRVFTVDVIVYGDAQELATLLQAQFPNASLKVIPVASNVLISGYVDQPEHADLIARIAEEYYPKVINNMTVSGVQQVLLHVKVMEVSRTKLRNLGFDFSQISGNNFVVSGVSGLISAVASGTGATTAAGLPSSSAGGPSFLFNIVDGSSAFFGVLEALRQDNLMKVLAEPALVTVSGRPARFLSGGEFPILVPQSLGTVSVEYKSFGTELDFVPIVLGNGRIRLEVRPRVSERDLSGGVTLDSVTAPALRTREVETGVEMQAGQTLAIAGLVQSRDEAENRGLPWVSEVPYVGALFRRVHHERNEIELLILVTPELVEPMDAHEVPLCGPGMRTTAPSDFELYLQGHLEVPNCCPPGCSQVMPGQALGGARLPQEGMILEENEPAAEAGQATLTKQTKWRNLYTPSKPLGQPADSPPAGDNPDQGFIGPTGYDVLE